MLSTICKALFQIWQGLNSLSRNLSVKQLPTISPREDTCSCTGKSSADNWPNVGQGIARKKLSLGKENLSPPNLALLEEEIPEFNDFSSRQNSNNNQNNSCKSQNYITFRKVVCLRFVSRWSIIIV